jgi:hypothetical protein
MDDESLKLMVEQALNNAENSNRNPHEGILDLNGD